MRTGVVQVVPQPGILFLPCPVDAVVLAEVVRCARPRRFLQQRRVKAMTTRILVLIAVLCACSDAQVRISQIYGAGGNSGTVWTHDFIELVNYGTSAADLTGWSLRYASGSGATWQMTPLAGSIAPMHYLLVQEAPGGAGTTPLPTPDITGTIAMSASAGKVLLMSAQTPVTGGCITGPEIVDLVGFGSSATCFEGDSAAPAPGTKLALFRKGKGMVDTDNNGTDFETGPPAPRSSSSAPLAVRASGSSLEKPNDVRLRCFPSPFNSMAWVQIELPRAGMYSVALLNVLGEEVQVLARGHQRAGTTMFALTAGSLPSAVYFCVLQGEGVREVERVVLLR
jgi:hypothetical protein